MRRSRQLSRTSDYPPSEQEAAMVERAFAGTNSGTNLSETEDNSDALSVPEKPSARASHPA
jgi:hypothetical protein